MNQIQHQNIINKVSKNFGVAKFLMNFRIVIFFFFSIMIQNGCTIIPTDYPATVIQRLLSGFQIRSLDVLTVIVPIRCHTA